MERQYLVIVERGVHNYAAYAPDLPGCVATGRTREETLENMRAAIRMHLAGLREDGAAIPEPSAAAEYVAV
jgi:predicted RNase H-like HicB family nuclease